jgi:hypothetical protein
MTTTTTFRARPEQDRTDQVKGSRRCPLPALPQAVACALLLAAGAPSPAAAQSSSDSTTVVATAVAYLADSLPLPDGQLTVDTVRFDHAFATHEERFPAPALARGVARELGAAESTYDELWECLRPPGVARWGGEPCHSRRFPPDVSALVQLRSVAFEGARAEAIVSFYWTHVQSPERSYVTMRQFTVDLAAGEDGWEVRRVRLRYEGIG